MERSQSSGCDGHARASRRPGSGGPLSNWVRQSRQRAGMAARIRLLRGRAEGAAGRSAVGTFPPSRGSRFRLAYRRAYGPHILRHEARGPTDEDDHGRPDRRALGREPRGPAAGAVHHPVHLSCDPDRAAIRAARGRTLRAAEVGAGAGDQLHRAVPRPGGAPGLDPGAAVADGRARTRSPPTTCWCRWRRASSTASSSRKRPSTGSATWMRAIATTVAGIVRAEIGKMELDEVQSNRATLIAHDQEQRRGCRR